MSLAKRMVTPSFGLAMESLLRNLDGDQNLRHNKKLCEFIIELSKDPFFALENLLISLPPNKPKNFTSKNNPEVIEFAIKFVHITSQDFLPR